MKRSWIMGGILAAGAIGCAAWLLWSGSRPEDERTAWVYRSPDDGFAITLPSDHWEPTAMQGAAAAFRNRRRGATVKVEVAAESLERFREESVVGMKHYLEQNQSAFEGSPSLTEGTTDAGDPYLYWTATAKDDEEPGLAYAAGSLVWCASRRETVGIMFHAPLGKTQRHDGDRAYFERASRTICLSVK